jgi:probable phosphoglycerate mutase
LTRIYLIRHAEAEGNLYRRAHGHTDSLLTKNGLAQTERLSEWFAHRPVDAVYSSDLRRAVRTAEAVASVCRKTVQTDPALREVRLGEWEDLPWGLIARSFDTMQWFEKKSTWTVEGAERVEDAGRRVCKAVTRIAAEHDGEYIAVVSHGCVIRELLSATTGLSVPHLDNASVSLLEIDGSVFKTEFIGENRHLGDLSTHAKQSWWRNDPDKFPDAELWFSPVKLPEDTDAAMDYSRKAWNTVYGSMENFIPERFEKTLTESSSTDPRYLQFVMEGDKKIGLFQMRDTGRLSAFDGHISLFFLDPDRRGLGLGAQLLGEAVSIARSSGKSGLSLRVFHKNISALEFYRKMGFTVFGSEQGYFGPLVHMRLLI